MGVGIKKQPVLFFRFAKLLLGASALVAHSSFFQGSSNGDRKPVQIVFEYVIISSVLDALNRKFLAQRAGNQN